MLKKEITDTLKQTALVLGFSVLIPVIFAANSARFPDEPLSFMWYLEWGFGYLIPFLTLYLAYNMFSAEDADGATEYIRSLPVSRWKLLAAKTLPRLTVAVVLSFAYTALVQRLWIPDGVEVTWWNAFLSTSSHLPGGISIGFPVLLMTYGFIAGIADRKNPILILAVSVPILYMIFSEGFSISHIYHIWWKLFQTDQYNHVMRLINSFAGIYFPATLPLLVLIPVFKSWDVSSGKIRSQRVLKRIAGPLVLIIALYTFEQLHLY